MPKTTFTHFALAIVAMTARGIDIASETGKCEHILPPMGGKERGWHYEYWDYWCIPNGGWWLIKNGTYWCSWDDGETTNGLCDNKVKGNDHVCNTWCDGENNVGFINWRKAVSHSEEHPIDEHACYSKEK